MFKITDDGKGNQQSVMIVTTQEPVDDYNYYPNACVFAWGDSIEDAFAHLSEALIKIRSWCNVIEAGIGNMEKS